MLIAGILVIAAALRLWGLNAGLWYDEIATLTRFVRLPASELFSTYGSLNNHILYTWLAKGFVSLFGEAPWALRAPAVILGVASIWATWRLLREVGLARVALVTAALLAVSYHHVWFSQNARGYTGILLFTTLSALYMLRGLKDRHLSDWALYAAFAAAALMTHLTAAFLLFAQGATALAFGAAAVFGKQRINPWTWLKGPLIGFGGAIVLVLLFYAPLIPDMVDTFTAYNEPAAGDASSGGEVEEWRNPLWTLFEIIRSFGIVGAAIPLAMIFAIAGAVRMTRKAPLVAIPFLVHIPLTIIILVLASFRVWPRYFFVDIGFLIACVVYGAFWAAELFEKIVPPAFRFNISALQLQMAGAAVMVLASLPLLANNYAAPKQDFVGARTLVMQELEGEDRVVTVGLADLAYGGYLAPDWPAIASRAELDAELVAPGSVWVVVAFPAHMRSKFPDVAERLDQEFELVKEFSGTLSGGDILIYRSMD